MERRQVGNPSQIQAVEIRSPPLFCVVWQPNLGPSVGGIVTYDPVLVLVIS